MVQHCLCPDLHNPSRILGHSGNTDNNGLLLPGREIPGTKNTQYTVKKRNSVHSVVTGSARSCHPFWPEMNPAVMGCWGGGDHPQLMCVLSCRAKRIKCDIFFKVLVFVERNSLVVLLFLPCTFGLNVLSGGT